MDKDTGKSLCLEDILVRDVLQGRQLVFLKESDKISEAILHFQANLINSAPVISHNIPILDKFLGFIDVIDCLGHLLQTAHSSEELINDDLEQTWHRNIQFSTQIVGAAVNSLTKNHYFPIDAPLLSAISILAQRIHRLAIFNENRIIVGVLCQSDVISFLAKHPMCIPPQKATKNLQELKIVTAIHHIVTVCETDKTIDAFKHMLENKVSAVTIRRTDGTVYSHLSASDLRNLGISNEIPLSLRSLMKTVGEFIELVREATSTSHKLITSSKTTSLSDVIYLLAASRVHRIWISEGDEIEGVASLTDLLKALLV